MLWIVIDENVNIELPPRILNEASENRCAQSPRVRNLKTQRRQHKEKNPKKNQQTKSLKTQTKHLKPKRSLTIMADEKNSVKNIDSFKRGAWTQDEDDILKKHVKENGPKNWAAAENLPGLSRGRDSCRLRWVVLEKNLKNRKADSLKKKGKGTSEEDTRQFVKTKEAKGWGSVEKIPGFKRGPWTQDEDDILRKYVKKNSPKNWASAENLPGLNRGRDSCRLRWVVLEKNLKNRKADSLKKGKWTSEEDTRLRQFVKTKGAKGWASVEKIPGFNRDAASSRLRWRYLQANLSGRRDSRNSCDASVEDREELTQNKKWEALLFVTQSAHKDAKDVDKEHATSGDKNESRSDSE